MMMIHNKLLAVINKCQEYEMFNVFADILPGYYDQAQPGLT